MAEKLPRLHKHFEIAGVDTSLITFNWMLCIYCDNVPPETMLHIWDCLLYEGSKVHSYSVVIIMLTLLGLAQKNAQQKVYTA